MFTNEDIKKLGVIKIVNTVSFDTLGHPTAGGLYDKRLGKSARHPHEHVSNVASHRRSVLRQGGYLWDVFPKLLRLPRPLRLHRAAGARC